LRVLAAVLADDLDRVLVGADGAVRAETEEYGAHRIGRLDLERLIHRQRQPCHVVDDADGEVRFGSSFTSSAKTAFTIAG
jgi:hypothetical protein